MHVFRVFVHHLRRRARAYGIGLLVFVSIVAYIFLLPPLHFPQNEFVEVLRDASFEETASMLEERGVIRSALLFTLLARVGQADRDIQAGRYYFDRPVGLTTVLYRLVNGISGIESVRVTFPEGYTVREMAQVLEESLPGFHSAAFRALARPYEGYLFPDTYYFSLDATPEGVVNRMRQTFEKRLETLEEVLALSDRSLEDIVIMASLLEKEARTEEEMRMVSGILWKRVDLNRGLQVDAVFGYIKGVDTYHPSGDDLEIDSPYNTYRYPGLPPGPIGNPGLVALRAALAPIDSEYLYYLTGKDGHMYYARTFEEHKKNRGLYLD